MSSGRRSIFAGANVWIGGGSLAASVVELVDSQTGKYVSDGSGHIDISLRLNLTSSHDAVKRGMRKPVIILVLDYHRCPRLHLHRDPLMGMLK